MTTRQTVERQALMLALGLMLGACDGDASDSGSGGDATGTGGADASGSDGDTGSEDGAGGTPPGGDDAADDGDNTSSGASDDGATSDDPPEVALSVSLFNVTMDIVDPRWPSLPATLSTVELTTAYTLAAQVPERARSVRFVLDDDPPVLDREAPFRLAELDDGGAAASALPLGDHTLRVEAFASPDGEGAPMVSADIPFELTSAGTRDAPQEHAVHRLWRTGSGVYVHRNEAGDFVDANDALVISGSDVSVVEMGDDQGHLVVEGSEETIEFAFIVLLPDGFDPAVAYPLVVFLHHGWEFYRGTDNDGRPLYAPLLGGERSLVEASEQRSRFPSIVIVPQLRRIENIDGVNHEWAAYTDLSNETGSFNSGPEVSVNTRPVLDVLDQLEAGTLVVDGQAPTIDAARIYLTGHSMGGLGTWDLLGRLPDRWAAAVPMAGYPDHTTAARLAQTPIWAFHHDNDCFNPVVGTETMHALITETHGGDRMTFTRFGFDTGGACDQAHFQTPGAAWNDEPGLFEWVFGQVNDRR